MQNFEKKPFKFIAEYRTKNPHMRLTDAEIIRNAILENYRKEREANHV